MSDETGIWKYSNLVRVNFLPYNREERISRGVSSPLNSKDS